MHPAIFFDMDGVLVDSEPEWQQAEISIFGELGLTLTPKDCMQTKGMRIDEVARFWFERAPWSGPDPDRVANRIVDEMVRRLREEGAAKSGAVAALEAARQETHCLAIVSSSAHRLIDAVVARLGVAELLDFRVSGEDVRYGKPHPEIYLTAAERAHAAVEQVWVIEDSLYGVLAAKAARMRCIAVPEEPDRDDPRFAIADEIQPSLLELDRVSWQARR
ncbi:MAG: hexitol phosphatase HxpB [Myxococcota bacterium]